MRRKGHEVHLYASGDSTFKGQLHSVVAKPWEEDKSIDPKVAECLHISQLMEEADQYDLIHNHFDFLPLTYSNLIRTPMITTIHGFSSEKIKEVYRKYNSVTGYVSISDSDRDSTITYLRTVYNGIDTSAFTLEEEEGNYLLYFGRIHPDKGTKEAVQVAQATGISLKIAGIVQDAAYWDKEVAPHVDGKQVEYLGSIGPEERDQLLGGALALLHLINFDEPFGLSVAEAMACGTPVIATERGSMPELIKSCKTGYLVNCTEEAVNRVADIASLDRSEIGAYSRSAFSIEAMVEGYEAAYAELLSI